MSATTQPDPVEGESEWPPPGDVAALEPDDLNVGLTAAKCEALIPKEIA